MPNIFKSFLRTQVDAYTIPSVDEIRIEEDEEDEDALEAYAAEEMADDDPESAEQADEDGEASDDRPGPDPGQGAAAMFSYARVQAETIVAQARQESEEMLARLRQQAEQEAERMREEARQEGFHQGYSDGMSKARVENRAWVEAQRAREAEQVRQFLEQAAEAREQLLLTTQDELRDLSIAVAEKIIHVSLKSSRDVILRMVQMATERLRRREWVRIYIGGCDSRELAQITPELTTALAGLSDHIKLIPMAGDESGTCIIEMPDEIIDASASTQLDNLKDILRGG